MQKGNEHTVYIVDDDDAVRDSLKELLEEEGFEIETFPSGEAFLNHFHPGGKSCLLLDVQLPGKSGIELLKTLGHRDHHLPVIVMTGNGDRITKSRAFEAGAAAFLEKPLDVDQLIDTLRTALQ